MRSFSTHLNNLATWQRLSLAVLTGFLQIVIFPKVGLFWVAWICVVPLLIACRGEVRSGRAFLWGFTSGFIFFVGVCYWITFVLRQYGDLAWVAASALFLLLVTYLSLFYGVFAILLAKLSLRLPNGALYLSPFLWIASEYLRAHFLTGFPWCLLGYSQVDCSNLVQLSTITGVYGVSFLIVAINALVACLFLNWGRSASISLAAACLILSGMCLWFRLQTEPVSPANQEVRIVQTHISPEQNWDHNARSALLDDLAALSGTWDDNYRATDPSGFRIVLWPETPAPFYFNNDFKFRQWMQDLAKTTNAYLLFGFVDLRTSESPKKTQDPYNSVALLSPEGDLISQYDKMHLVPFGEYVPYSSIFFFVDKISTEAGDFRAGKRVVVSPLAAGHALGTLVCYEAIFPDLVRRFVSQGAQVLVNVTNDTWFGDTAAPYQHLNMARFRAIENHRYLLRAANSGISAIIDPYGRIKTRSALNERTQLDSVFEWKNERTIYARYGDAFAWSCLGIDLLALGWLIRDQSRTTSRLSRL